MNKEEILINTQFTFFFKERLTEINSLSLEIKNSISFFKNSTEEVFPLPDDIRLDDIPLVSVTSTNGVYRYEISKGRLNFYITGEGKESFSAKEGVLIQNTEKLFSLLKEADNKIKRVGFVTRFFIEDNKKDEVIEKILIPQFITIHKEKTSQDSSSFFEAFIRYVRKTEFLKLSINNYTTIEKFNARISGISDSVDGVLITRDINTNQEDEEKNSEILNESFSVKQFIEESKERFQLNEIKKILW